MKPMGPFVAENFSCKGVKNNNRCRITQKIKLITKTQIKEAINLISYELNLLYCYFNYYSIYLTERLYKFTLGSLKN